MNTGQAVRNIQPVAGRAALRLNADLPDASGKRGQLVGYLHQLCVELVVLHAFENLVVPVQAAVEAVMGAAP